MERLINFNNSSGVFEGRGDRVITPLPPRDLKKCLLFNYIPTFIFFLRAEGGWVLLSSPPSLRQSLKYATEQFHNKHFINDI